MSRTVLRLILLWTAIGLFALRELIGLPLARDRIEADGIARLQLVSRSMQQAVGLTLSGADATALRVAEALAHQPAGKPGAAQELLERQLPLAGGLAALAYIGADGRIAAGTHRVPLGTSVADQAYFRLLRDAPAFDRSMGPAVAPVAACRLTGLPSLVLARRVVDAHGRFAGIVAGSIGIDAGLAPLFATLRPSPSMSFGIFDRDYRLMVGVPHVPERVGRYFAEFRTDVPRLTPTALQPVAYAGVDGLPRIGVMQPLEGFPLLLGVGERRDTLFAAWPDILGARLAILAGLLTLGGVVSVLILRRRREDRRERLNASVFAHSGEGILITTPDARIVEANPRMTELTGYPRDEMIGATPRMFNSGRHDADFYRRMWESLVHRGQWRGEVWNRRKDGSFYAQAASLSAVRDRRGAVTHYIGLFRDITEQKTRTEQLERSVNHDALTGLPNRTLFGDRLRQALARARREKHMLAVCYIDLDGFKPVNDTYGHAAGDRLLIEVADRLRRMIRGGDTAARVGGDEFVIVFATLEDEEECRLAVERILASITEPVDIGNDTEVSISASIGLALYPRDAEDPDDLVLLADEAMYQSKRSGRNRYSELAP